MSENVQHRTVQFEEVNLPAGAHRVSARVAGAGRPLVLCHSLLADDTSFDRVAARLAQDHLVMILRLPGFPGSDRVENGGVDGDGDGGGIAAVADRVAAALQAYGFEQAPVLLGNGYGGFVALMAAIRHPGLAQRLVLADCGAAFTEEGRAAFRGMSAAAAAKGLEAVAEIAMRRLFSPAFQQANPALIAERKERFLAVDPATFHAACGALAELDMRPRLAEVKVPALVLVGEFDEATPPPMSRELAAGLSDARLVILPDCAHVPQLQNPDLFLATLGPFLAA